MFPVLKDCRRQIELLRDVHCGGKERTEQAKALRDATDQNCEND